MELDTGRTAGSSDRLAEFSAKAGDGTKHIGNTRTTTTIIGATMIIGTGIAVTTNMRK